MSRALRILVTGSAGCAGSHLVELAIANGAAVVGIDRRPHAVTGVRVHIGEISEPGFVRGVIEQEKPDWVFHLAAQIPQGRTEVSPEQYVTANVTGTFQVLDAVRRAVPRARVLVASSSAVYGRPDRADQPISEGARLQPQSLYAVTKVAQDLMVGQFFEEHRLHAIAARTFNQVGPREPAGLVCATLAMQVAAIEAGTQPPILRAVTLVPRRDFTDVRDVVAGYWLALEHGQAGLAYNICSGRSVAVRQVAEMLVGVSRVPEIHLLETGPAPGPTAILNQVGDASLLWQCSGWKPVVSLSTSLADLLHDCRARVRATGTPRVEIG